MVLVSSIGEQGENLVEPELVDERAERARRGGMLVHQIAQFAFELCGVEEFGRFRQPGSNRCRQSGEACPQRRLGHRTVGRWRVRGRRLVFVTNSEPPGHRINLKTAFTSVQTG